MPIYEYKCGKCGEIFEVKSSTMPAFEMKHVIGPTLICQGTAFRVFSTFSFKVTK